MDPFESLNKSRSQALWFFILLPRCKPVMEKLIMMSIKSQALEVNLASYHVDVSIDERYLVLREIMHKYHGLMERFDTFLKELSHPYKNWRFIVKEARTFSLDYFRQLQNHEKGPDAAELYAHIFSSAVKASSSREVKTDAADNLLLFLSKIATFPCSPGSLIMPAMISGAFRTIIFLSLLTVTIPWKTSPPVS